MKVDSQKIVLILAEKTLTHTLLAELSGISRQSISTIIARGTCAPITAGKLARGLGVELNEIVREN